MAKKNGRPSKYKPEYDLMAEKLCMLFNAINEDLAAFFEVDRDTIYEWQKTIPSFSDALKRGKENPDNEIEKSLHRRAKGYMRLVQRLDKHGDVVEIEEHVPPDPTSMIFYLKNRRPERWRDKVEHDLSEGAKQAIVNLSLKAK